MSSLSVASQITWDELERKHKANQLKDWVVATFPDVSNNNKKAITTTTNNTITLEKVFTALINGSIRSDNPFNGIVMLRAIIQHLPTNRLHSLIVPEDLMKWLTSYAMDIVTIKTIQRASVLAVIVQLLKNCSLLQNQRVIPYLTRIIEFNLSTLYDEMKNMIATLPSATTANDIPASANSVYVGDVMVIHQLEDMILILGSSNQSIDLINTWPVTTSTSSSSSSSSSTASSSSPLMMPIKLFGEVMRIGTMRLNSPHGEQFDLDICKIFAMLSEIVVSSISSSTSTSTSTNAMVIRSIDGLTSGTTAASSMNDLVSGLEKVIEIIVSGKVVHDSFLSAFHHGLELLVIVMNRFASSNELRNQMMARMISLYQRIVNFINEVALDNVVNAKRVEILIGVVASFYEEVTILSTAAVNTNTNKSSMYHLLMTCIESNGSSGTEATISSTPSQECIDLFIQNVSQLQVRMKEALTVVTAFSSSSSSSDQLKDFKIIFSDIRKGCISTLDHIFLMDSHWLSQSTSHRKLFWELSIKQLSTPILFASAYHSALSQYPVYVKMMVEYLQKAMKMISNYSLTASEDIIETIKQLLVYNCQELLVGNNSNNSSGSSSGYEVNIIPALCNCLHQFPKSLTNNTTSNSSNSQSVYKWKTSICLTLQEAFSLLCRKNIVTDSMMQSTMPLIPTLFQEIIQEHIKANSPFTSTNTTGKNNKKSTRKMKEVDGSVDLFHAACATFSTICDYVMLVKSMPSDAPYTVFLTGSWQEMALCCLEGVLKPLIFEDDLVDILLTSDLLARLTVLLATISSSTWDLGSLKSNNIFVACILALTICGPIKKDDLVSERLLVTLKLFVTETLTMEVAASSNNTKNLLFQINNVLGNDSFELTKEENETMMISANAAVSLIMERVILPLTQSSITSSAVAVSRLQLLRRVVDALK